MGKPLVRDCSCRGDAGFAHLSRIKEYAQRTSVDLDIDRLVTTNDEANYINQFTIPWRKCSSCHQLYQHDLAIDLANCHLRFVEEKYPGNSSMDQWRYISALAIKLEAIKTMDCRNMPHLREEGKQLGQNVLSAARNMQSGASPWVLRRGRYYEAAAHEFIAYFDTMSKDTYKEGIKHYQSARDIFIVLGNMSSAKIAESVMANIKAQYEDGGALSSEEAELKDRRDVYDYFVRSRGETAIKSIVSGVNLANSLHKFYHRIESERLASKLAAISLRVYGSEHDITKKAVSVLKISKRRLVVIPSHADASFKDSVVVFEALQYDADEDAYVLMKARRLEADGQVNVLREPTNEDGQTFLVGANDIICHDGTPVVCHGLINASHLNGKIGDAREYNFDTDRYAVHFDDMNLKPVSVRRENLRIVFELPAVVEEYEDVKASSTSIAGATAETQTEEAAAAIVDEAADAHIAAVLLAETRAEEAAAALLAELDLEEKETSSTTNQQKGKKKKGKKKRNR